MICSELLRLDLDEHELVRVRIDDVVLDPDIPCVRLPGRKLRHDLPLRGLLHQLARRHPYHDLVMRMLVPSRLRPWRETPFRHDRALGWGEEFGGGLGTGSLSEIFITETDVPRRLHHNYSMTIICRLLFCRCF